MLATLATTTSARIHADEATTHAAATIITNKRVAAATSMLACPCLMATTMPISNARAIDQKGRASRGLALLGP